MPNILSFQAKMKICIFCSQRVLFSGKQNKPKIFYFPLESLFTTHEYKNVFVHLFPERVQGKWMVVVISPADGFLATTCLRDMSTNRHGRICLTDNKIRLDGQNGIADTSRNWTASHKITYVQHYDVAAISQYYT